jgi:hypothetical protein
MSSTHHPVAPATEAAVSEKSYFTRLDFVVLLTLANLWVTAEDAPILYHAYAGRPLLLAGITVLFVGLYASLVHVWFVLLRRKTR